MFYSFCPCTVSWWRSLPFSQHLLFDFQTCVSQRDFQLRINQKLLFYSWQPLCAHSSAVALRAILMWPEIHEFWNFSVSSTRSLRLSVINCLVRPSLSSYIRSMNLSEWRHVLAKITAFRIGTNSALVIRNSSDNLSHSPNLLLSVIATFTLLFFCFDPYV